VAASGTGQRQRQRQRQPWQVLDPSPGLSLAPRGVALAYVTKVVI
jgi:hypothetical protein